MIYHTAIIPDALSIPVNGIRTRKPAMSMFDVVVMGALVLRYLASQSAYGSTTAGTSYFVTNTTIRHDKYQHALRATQQHHYQHPRHYPGTTYYLYCVLLQEECGAAATM